MTLPKPPGWTKYANPNFSPGTTMIAKNNTYPTAMVVVLKLTGNFDVAEALKHASVDANSPLSSLADTMFALSDYCYQTADGRRLHTYNRVVIPVTPAPKFQRYLVQFTVTTLADQAAVQSDDIEAVIKGFTVTVK